MTLNFILLDIDNNPVINGSEKNLDISTSASTSVPVKANFGKDFGSTIFVYLILFAAIYLFFIRPQKKRQENLISFQNNLKAGDSVITSSGLHGKIIEIGDQTFLVEFGIGKTIRMHVDKSQIISSESTTQIKQQE